MTDTETTTLNPQQRLAEIADQLRDGWIRGRGPLTGLKALVEASHPQIFASPDGLEAISELCPSGTTVLPIDDQVAILRCTAGYPAAWDELDLVQRRHLRDLMPASGLPAMPVSCHSS